jgi:hypothetical protein
MEQDDDNALKGESFFLACEFPGTRIVYNKKRDKDRMNCIDGFVCGSDSKTVCVEETDKADKENVAVP